MAFAYAVTNLLSGLAAAAFTPLLGPADSTRSYLNDGRMDRQYAFTARAASNSVVIDLGSAKSVAGWAILNHNLATLGTVSLISVFVTGADDAAITVNTVAWAVNPLLTPYVTAPTNKDLVMQFSATSRRYWRVQVFWSGTQTLKIGELFAYGAPAQFSRGQVDGSGETEEVVTLSARMQTGETRSMFMAGPIRQKLIKTIDLTAAERDEWLSLFRVVRGPVTPFLWIETYEAVNPGADHTYFDCIFGRLMLDAYNWSWADFAQTNTPDIMIRSLGREVGA